MTFSRLASGLRGWAPDMAIAAVVATVLVVVSAHVPVTSGARALDAPGYALLVVTGIFMGLCRRLPRTTLAVVSAVQVIFVLQHYPNGPVWITGLIALAILGWKTTRRTAIVGAVGLFLALSAAAAVVGSSGVLEPAIYLGWSAAAVLLGDVLRNRRSYLAGQAERARMVIRGREEETARRIAEERLRIARDLHDSVAHAMATINVQAGVAAHLLARRPEAAGPGSRRVGAPGSGFESRGRVGPSRRDAERARRDRDRRVPGGAGVVDQCAATLPGRHRAGPSVRHRGYRPARRNRRSRTCLPRRRGRQLGGLSCLSVEKAWSQAAAGTGPRW